MALFKIGLTNAEVQNITDTARLQWEKLYQDLPDKKVLPEGLLPVMASPEQWPTQWRL